MARNNLAWIKGDITGDIYYDNFHLDSKDVQYLRLYLMIKGVVGAAGVKGVRVCVYGPLAELVYGHESIQADCIVEAGQAGRM